ncbi:MAG: DUF5666 domain-containing protein [Candidatus Omnitrophota bacterium]
MKRSIKFIFCLFLIISVLTVIGSPFAFSQEEKAGALAKEISGDIASVDLKNSAIVIKQLKDEKSLTYETVTVYVDNSTSIEDDYETITIAEIKAGDRVTVEYVTDKAGKNIASNIRVKPKE